MMTCDCRTINLLTKWDTKIILKYILVPELTSTIKTHLEPIKDDLIFDDIHQEIGKRVCSKDESGTDKIMTLTWT